MTRLRSGAELVTKTSRIDARRHGYTDRSSTTFRPIHIVEWDVLSPVPVLAVEIAAINEVHTFGCLCGWVQSRLDLSTWTSSSQHRFPSRGCLGIARLQVSDRCRPDKKRPADRHPTIGDRIELDANQLAFVTERTLCSQNAPDVSVVLCTRDRPKRVADCVREVAAKSIRRTKSSSSTTRRQTRELSRAVLDTMDASVPVRYVLEPRGGLSWARNAGWKAATADIIAFLDDDEIPDEHWLAELVRGFSARSKVGCVTGMVLPAELRTEPQQWFEGLGGFRQGRGFTQEVFDPRHAQSPLYPFPPFGAGANMAFRRGVLADIGGFDVALGAGTPAKASEETLAFARTRLAEHTIVYQPTAMVSHYHRETLAELKTQLHNYSIGTTAHYTSLIMWKPRLLLSVLRLIPRAVKDNLPWKDPVRMATMRDSPGSW